MRGSDRFSSTGVNFLRHLTRDIFLKKIFVGNLPENATESSVTELFSEFGTVRSIQLIQDIFSGKCKGFCFIEMEGHDARAAIAGCDGKMYEGKPLKVKFEDDRAKGKGKRRR